jgi:hypothetical protein
LKQKRKKDKLKKREGVTMGRKESQNIWVYEPQIPKFTANEKLNILSKTKELIKQSVKITKKISKLEMRANRIYLYELVKQFQPEGAVITKPLIDGKYLEYYYARITLYDVHGKNCTVDWQRHNNQWMTVYSGGLAECISNIENDECWF